MIISLLNFLNSILLLIVIIIIILEFLKADYPMKNEINKELSKIQVPFNDNYKIFLLILIPIIISFFITIFLNIIY